MPSLRDPLLPLVLVVILLVLLSTAPPIVAATGSLTDPESTTMSGGSYAVQESSTETPTQTPMPSETESATATPGGTETDPPTPTETDARTETSTGTGASPTDTRTDSASSGPPLVVENLSAPTAVRNGDTMTVAATIRNPGSETATGTLRYTFDARTVQSRQVTLDPGTSERLTFEVSTATIQNGSLSPGSYVHGVRNESGKSIPRRIRVTPDADLRLGEFDAPVEVSRNSELIVLATAENPANTSITRRVTYQFAGRSIRNKTVTVPGGGESQVAFAANLSEIDAAGVTVENGTTYNHAIVAEGGASTGDAVRVRPGPSADPSVLAVEGFQAPDRISPGDAVSVTLTLRNVGQVPYEGQLAYRLDGAVVATTWIEVPADNQRVVRFQLQYADIERAAVPVASRQTTHGVFVGSTALQTRPVTIDAPTPTPTPRTTPTPTFEPVDTETATSTPESSCERGFITPCGGSPLDQSTLTRLGAISSMLGIIFELVRGN